MKIVIVLVYVTDSCSPYEYNYLRYKVKSGTDCSKFCQCAPLRTNIDGSVDYYWQEQSCPATTQFDESTGVCNHEVNVQCNDGTYRVLHVCVTFIDLYVNIYTYVHTTPFLFLDFT